MTDTTKPVMTQFSPVPIPDIQAYLDYKPTAFDSELTMLQKVNKLIKAMQDVGASTTDVINQWNSVMTWLLNGGVDQAVIDQLNNWKNDGTLDSIINQDIFNDLNTKIDNQVQKESDDIATVNQSISDGLASKLDVSKLPWIDLLQYATSNNLDISTAFQNLLDKASTVGWVHIKVPKSDYILTKELKVYANTFIDCHPDAYFKRNHSGYILVNGNKSTEANPSTYTGYTGRGNITIKGGIWDGNGVSQTAKASNMHFAHADTIRIMDAVFKDVSNSHHIEFNSSKNIWVNNCRFLGWVGSSDTFDEAIQLDVAKLSATIVGADDGTPCRDVWIENCYFGDSGTQGSNSIARGVGSHNATIGMKQTNINIKGCVFENLLSWAIRCYNYEDVTITGNQFKNVGAGVNVRAAITGVATEDATGNQVGAEKNFNFVINDNVFDGEFNAGRAIEIYGESGTNGWIQGVTVSGNTIHVTDQSTSYDAINFTYVQTSVISGNRIQDCKGNSIDIKGTTTFVSITGNTIVNSGEDGIHIEDGSKYITVTGNTVITSQQNSVYVDGCTSIVINANNLIGANGMNDVDKRNPIRVVSSASLITIVGNICQNYSTTYVTDRAIYSTNTITDITIMGNVCVGLAIFNSGTGGTADANGNLT